MWRPAKAPKHGNWRSEMSGSSSSSTVAGAGVGELPTPAKSAHAFVTLVMLPNKRQYAAGAMVLAASLRRHSPDVDRVCMVTPDVTSEVRADLGTEFTHVIEVPYIQCRTRPPRTHKQKELYASSKDVMFTKWRCLGLAAYTKVLFLDADTLAVQRLDDVFDREAPAAVFNTPFTHWSDTEEPGRGCPHVDGAEISRNDIYAALEENNGALGAGSCVLLAPASRLDVAFEEWLHATAAGKPFGSPCCYSLFDEQALAEFMLHQVGATWHHLGAYWCCPSFRPSFVDGETSLVRVLHFIMCHPWRYVRSKATTDTWPWFDCAQRDLTSSGADALRKYVPASEAESAPCPYTGYAPRWLEFEYKDEDSGSASETV